MSLRTARLTAALLAVLAIGACQTPPPQQRLPELSFANQAPYRLNVGRVEVVSEFQSPNRPPHIEQMMPLSPEAAVKRWVQQRLAPMGTSGAVRVVIKDARVVEVPLQTDKSVTGLFKKEQSEQYDAHLQLVIQVLDERNLPVAEIIARSNRSRSVAEGTTLNERDRIWYGMVEDMMVDLNRQLDGLIPQYLGPHLMR